MHSCLSIADTLQRFVETSKKRGHLEKTLKPLGLNGFRLFWNIVFTGKNSCNLWGARVSQETTTIILWREKRSLHSVALRIYYKG
nr:MAG TPA: hypothetical protein [Caudoviricetes sp.]